MAAPKLRTKDQQAAILADIATRYRAGATQAAIGAALGLSQQQISYYLDKLVQEWRTSALTDLDTVKAQELARIDLLEREAWAEYERSKRPVKKLQVVTETGSPDAEAILPDRTRTTETTEHRLGDERFLARVAWCVEQRCKIFGLYAPTGINLAGKDGGPLTIEIVYADVDLDPAPAPRGPAGDPDPGAAV